MSLIVVFVCSWWLCLLMVLPLWLKRDESGEPSKTSPGAPENPYIMRKFVITTLMAIACTIGIYYLTQTDLMSFREISHEMANEDYQ